MSKINEQIQRLRDVLVTCYKAIKSKGGTIPEAGERNMTNLPAAVASIPQTHGELTELTVTTNGEYLPAEHDADGFSKVTANFDISSLPKVKLSGSLNVTNKCIQDGYFPAELIDTEYINNLASSFLNCKSLTQLDVSNWDVSNITNMYATFQGCGLLTMLDFTKWNVSNVGTINLMFLFCNKLQSIIGYRTIEEVINDNISCLNGLKKCDGAQFSSTILDRASLRAVINGLADLTGQTAQTLALGTTLLAKLTEEDIAIATNKNWTIA